MYDKLICVRLVASEFKQLISHPASCTSPDLPSSTIKPLSHLLTTTKHFRVHAQWAKNAGVRSWRSPLGENPWVLWLLSLNSEKFSSVVEFSICCQSSLDLPLITKQELLIHGSNCPGQPPFSLRKGSQSTVVISEFVVDSPPSAHLVNWWLEEPKVLLRPRRRCYLLHAIEFDRQDDGMQSWTLSCKCSRLLNSCYWSPCGLCSRQQRLVLVCWSTRSSNGCSFLLVYERKQGWIRPSPNLTFAFEVNYKKKKPPPSS